MMILILMGISIGAGYGLRPSDATAAAPLPIIPALHQWTPNSGSFTFTASSRIVVDTEHAAHLAGTAATLADDLAVLTGHAVAVVTESRPAPGDLFLTIDDGQGAEKYRMTVGESVRITGGDPVGVLYGTRTVLQLLHQASSIPAGTASDGPSDPARGLMVDVGR